MISGVAVNSGSVQVVVHPELGQVVGGRDQVAPSFPVFPLSDNLMTT